MYWWCSGSIPIKTANFCFILKPFVVFYLDKGDLGSIPSQYINFYI